MGLEGLDERVTVPQPQALGQHVLEQLRILIIKRALGPGTHLVESQLSESFRVSRGPVRDALTQLEAEGLVESRRRGVFVLGLTEADIDELYVVRETIEAAALRLAARASAQRWRVTADQLIVMKTAAGINDYGAYARADLAFHGSFYEVAGNSRLRRIWAQYQPTFQTLLELTNAEDLDLQPSYTSHLEIYDCARQGSLDEAVTNLHVHLRGSQERLLAAYARLEAIGSS